MCYLSDVLSPRNKYTEKIPYTSHSIHSATGTATFTDVAVSASTTPPKKCGSYLDYKCSCMVYLQTVKGYSHITGDAIDLIPTHFKNPKSGDVIIFHYPTVGHAAYIEAVMPKAYYISEWNYYEGEYSERVIMKNDPHIHGFIRP